MGDLAFQCPTTRDWVSSGVETDEGSIALVRPLKLRIGCRCCGEQHEVFLHDARILNAA